MKTACLLLTSLALFGSSASGRTWTSVDGRTIEADFVRLRGDSVVVDKGGKTVTIPLEKLAKADRDWVASKAAAAKPGTGSEPDTKRVTQILEATLKAEPSDAERAEVVALLVSLLPTKGADGEAIEWKVNFSGSQEPRTEVILTANMHPKGDEENRLMWIHFLFQAKAKKVHHSEKFGRYPALRYKDHHCFVTVNRTDVRCVAEAKHYKSDKKIDAIIKAIDLKTIGKL